MLKTNRAIIVEGKYDKIKLSGMIEAVIICTDGFGVFTDPDKLAIIRHYAKTTGIIILTDSDRAGFRIRSFIKGAVNEGSITNIYIPDIFGKERRKANPSKEGKLGVEGMTEEILREAFERSGVLSDSDSENAHPQSPENAIDKLLLYELGLSGSPDSSERRHALCEYLELPSRMTANALIEILRTILTAEELIKICTELFGEGL
ncbi:MAG: DUF4093 domain-containing protein [Oscillospiraceae bacterium]|nr:DUF4093 domain-containing protein [Oscillospiraceae bacterium]